MDFVKDSRLPLELLKIENAYIQSLSFEQFKFEYETILKQYGIKPEDFIVRDEYQSCRYIEKTIQDAFINKERDSTIFLGIDGCIGFAFANYPTVKTFESLLKIYDCFTDKKNEEIIFALINEPYDRYPFLFFECLVSYNGFFMPPEAVTCSSKIRHTDLLPFNYRGIIPYLFVYKHQSLYEKFLDICFKITKLYPNESLCITISLLPFLYCFDGKNFSLFVKHIEENKTLSEFLEKNKDRIISSLNIYGAWFNKNSAEIEKTLGEEISFYYSYLSSSSRASYEIFWDLKGNHTLKS